MNRHDGEGIEELNRQDAKGAKEEEEEGRRGEKSRDEDEEERRKKLRVEPGAGVDDLAHRVVGAAIEVHRHLGPGFLEGVYEDALEEEFRLREILNERKKPVSVV